MSQVAEDNFEVYFTEKIWEMIPYIYRHEDGLMEHPDVLRSLVEIMARQAAILRRSQDRLWEDQFIEWCSDWAVPYIADLVATRLLPLENKRGRRVDVAKTIYYRRRKGTPRVLEELISDITQWDGKMVENFRRLGRARHGLDPFPERYSGQFSRTPSGGIADLRNPYASQLAGGPFDEYHHTPDMRRHHGQSGRYNIPKLAFHLYRIRAFEVLEVTPYASTLVPGCYAFDPSGRNNQVFIARYRPESWENWDWHSAFEWELSAPMRCRLLGHAVYEITEESIMQLIASPGISATTADELRYLRNWRFYTEGRLNDTLAGVLSGTLNDGQKLALLEYTLIDGCGKKALSGNSISVEVAASLVLLGQMQAGNLLNWTAVIASEKFLVIDPENGRFMFTNLATLPDANTVLANYHYGFPGEIGAGTYDRRDVQETAPSSSIIPAGGGAIGAGAISHIGEITEIQDNRTYGPIANKIAIQSMTLQAINRKRPYLRLQDPDWQLNSGGNTGSCLTLDGLWIGAAPGENPPIRLMGDFECVIIKNCTIDPGGDTTIDGTALHPVPIRIEGRIEKMLILSSICGPISIVGSGSVEEMYIEDAIIQSLDDAVPALDLNQGTVEMNRVTVMGAANIHRLSASETLLAGETQVTDTQNGCFRFSAGYSGSVLPQPYESYFLEGQDHWFTSKRFGHYGYGQLSETAPQVLHRGAENRSEIGAFSSLINPILLDSLRVKVEEYMPFGLIPLFINET